MKTTENFYAVELRKVDGKPFLAVNGFGDTVIFQDKVFADSFIKVELDSTAFKKTRVVKVKVTYEWE